MARYVIEDDNQAPSGGFVIEDAPQGPRGIGQAEELSTLEKFAASLPDWMAGSGGGVRGSAVGRMAMGAADPGVALVQMVANAVGAGGAVNKGIRETEAKYQAAREAAGSTGFDPLRMAGSTAITLPVGLAGKAATTLGGMAAKGGLQGAVSGALNPVVEGDSFLAEKAKQIGIGAAGGALLAPVADALSRIVSPKASVDPRIAMLREEGVNPTVGQTLGGVANSVEEKLQSVPIMGDAIRAMRDRAANQFRAAALDRAAKPIGETVKGDGYEAIAELSAKIGKKYDEVLPKMAVNVLDDGFVNRMANLRGLAKNLPSEEARQFDAVIAREIDGRLSPNGTLSGQNLKDAWLSLRNTAQEFSNSPDAYQKQLGQALKQVFQELKDQVTRVNKPEDVISLKNADHAWANFKRLQRAASSVGAEEGRFSPAQLQGAVKALDRSRDKARFAEGDALMQDLSGAGKAVLTNKVADSGTPTRLMWGVGGLATGAMINPLIPAALVGGAAAYAPPVQNALVYLLSRRPDMAPQLAEAIRRLSGPTALIGAGAAQGAQ